MSEAATWTGRVHEEDQEGAGHHHLRDQHRLRPLARLPLEVGELAAAQADRARGERLPDLRAVLGDQAQRGGEVPQLVDLDLLAEHAERLPRGLPGDPGVGQRVPDPPERPALADLAGGHQRLGHAPAAGQVHRDQVEEGADRVPEVPAPLLHLLPQLEVGQEEEHDGEDQADPDRDDDRQVQAERGRGRQQHDRDTIEAEDAEQHLGRRGSSRRTCRPARGWRAATGTPSPARRRTGRARRRAAG